MPDIPMEALKVCAIRETFEEVGVLLSDPPGSSLSQNQAPTEQEYRTWRKQLSQDSSSFLTIYSRLSSESRKVRPPIEQLVE
jgi:8-oxo-dGTP pyrophosphatase MutT (NUDIX family)